MKEKIAKVIRVVTVPPIVILIMLSILFCSFGEEFATAGEFVMVVIFLSFVPSFSYLLAKIRKGTSENTREGQRNMAFILNFGGYLLALIIGKSIGCSEMLMCVLVSFFLAVMVLTFLNKVCKIRASGHACSCVLPYLFLSYWFRDLTALICIIFYVIEFWASIKLKRHTVSEFIAGSIIAFVAFGLAVLYFGFYWIGEKGMV